MILVTSPEQRCPYPPGTKVRYWHYADNSNVALPTTIIGTVAIVDGVTVVEIPDINGNPFRVEEVSTPPISPNEPQRWFQEGINPNNVTESAQ